MPTRFIRNDNPLVCLANYGNTRAVNSAYLTGALRTRRNSTRSFYTALPLSEILLSPSCMASCSLSCIYLLRISIAWLVQTLFHPSIDFIYTHLLEVIYTQLLDFIYTHLLDFGTVLPSEQAEEAAEMEEVWAGWISVACHCKTYSYSYLKRMDGEDAPIWAGALHEGGAEGITGATNQPKALKEPYKARKYPDVAESSKGSTSKARQSDTKESEMVSCNHLLSSMFLIRSS